MSESIPYGMGHLVVSTCAEVLWYSALIFSRSTRAFMSENLWSSTYLALSMMRDTVEGWMSNRRAASAADFRPEVTASMTSHICALDSLGLRPLLRPCSRA